MSIVSDIEYNLLANGSFELFTRGTGPLSVADGGFGPDYWRMTRENHDFAYTLGEGPISGMTDRFYGFFRKAFGTGKVMVFQGLNGYNTAPMRNNQLVTVQLQLRTPNARVMKLAFIKNTGVENTIVPMVSTWNANTVNPTLGTGLAYITTKSITTTTAWSSYFITGPVTSDCKNLIFAIFSDTQFLHGAYIELGRISLYYNDTLKVYQPTPSGEEKARLAYEAEV